MAEQSFVRHGRHRGNFLDRLADGLAHAVDHALEADDLSRRDGLLQRLDPRVKLGGVFGLILVAVFVKSLAVLAALFWLAVGLAAVSRVGPWRLARQVWIGVLAFTGLIALPAVFLVPGDVLFNLPVLSWPVTLQGVRSAAFLLGRSETAATYALLLVLTTSWPHLLKAMRAFRVPTVLIVIFGLTHRYVFVFLRVATQMLEARRSRLVGPLAPRDRRRLATATAGVLLTRAFDMSTEVHLAMVSRGYRGEPRLLDEFRMRPLDWAAVAGSIAVAAMALWWQA
ncbi:MAG: cobalt ECF transporter T component CbiQ [Pseudolabrys sp.]|jgi:cobalt/nickel transport system permease protein